MSVRGTFTLVSPFKFLSTEGQELLFSCSLCEENRQTLPSQHLTALGWPGRGDVRCLRALNCGQQVRPASRGLARAKDVPGSPSGFGAKALFPNFPSRLFPSHHKLFDPLSHPDTEKKRVKDPTSWYKGEDKGGPGPQGPEVRASPPPPLLSFAVL